MAKFSGVIGYYYSEKEVRPGVWEQFIDERHIFGDFIRNSKRTENHEQYNDDINVTNQISFVADPYAMTNFHRIKYVTYLGSKWAVTSVEVEFPRLILNLGGIYHDEHQTCST